MVEILDLETGRAGMAGIARLVGEDVVDRFGRGADAAAERMTAGAVLGGVLEDAVHMALFAHQRNVHIAQQESGPGMVEGIRDCYLGLGRKRQRTAEQHHGAHEIHHGAETIIWQKHRLPPLSMAACAAQMGNSRSILSSILPPQSSEATAA